jgi:hypothetical protein
MIGDGRLTIEKDRNRKKVTMRRTTRNVAPTPKPSLPRVYEATASIFSLRIREFT